MLNRQTKVLLYGSVLVAIFVSIGYLLGANRDLRAPPALFDRPPIAACVKESLLALAPSKIDAVLLKNATELCYSQLHGEGLLNDFQIRRLKFVQQAYDERILLWMVVAITISGVGLAGLQLLASFRLASSGKGEFEQGGEISLERTRLSMKSSVTGLFILALSFAFFAVFVYEIFTIKEIRPDAQASGVQQDRQQFVSGKLEPSLSKSASQQREVLLEFGGVVNPKDSQVVSSAPEPLKPGRK